MAAAERELPEGTVTLLFSDIEGSTTLLTRLGDLYGTVLSVQRALLRDAFGTGGGHELGTEGDSFYVVFKSAVDAVRSCVAGQRALRAHDWPGGVKVRVRMGLHSGEPTRHEDAYVGMDVHRAARIAAAAHGGQVVLSDVTRQLVEPRLPAELTLRDLGWHRLKDIEEPERIFQLVVAGLEERFPALKSLGAPTSLPLAPTPLVGRDGALEQLRTTVLQPGVRLVTLTGTGGVGKTRLALAGAWSLCDAFQHGVFFFALAAVRETDGIWKTLAEGLGVGDEGPAADTVIDHLKTRRALLVLDNLEHLHGAAGVVTALLRSAQSLVILATSRRPLHLQGEREQPLPPLDVPPEAGVEVVAASGAAQLFAQQATMVRPGFVIGADNAADIAAVCRRLDGLPLAIELAASRAKLLTPKALLAHLGRSLDLAAGDVDRPSRQQTLRATIAWSCELLSPDLEPVFRRAGVFAGGCALDALAAVAGPESALGTDDVLEQVSELLDVSLITVSDGVDGEPRVAMLETIREFALERLEASGDVEMVRLRHAEFYAALAERAKEQLQGPGRLAWLDHLEVEHDNMRAALRWSLGERTTDGRHGDEKAIVALRLVRALAQFWYEHGHATEGRRWLERAIELASDEAGAPLAHTAHWLGVLLQQQGENEAALSLFERSLGIWRDLDDRGQTARELNSLGITNRHLRQLDTARALLEESIALAREQNDGSRLASALNSLGHVETDAGNLRRATEVLQEALAIDRKLGDALGATIDRQSLAVTSLCAGRAEEAGELLSSTLDYVAASGHVEFLATTVELSAAIAASLGDSRRAARLCGAAAAVRDRAEMPVSQPDAALLERFVGPARASIDPRTWNTEIGIGRDLTEQQLIELVAAPAAAGAPGRAP